MKNSSLLSTTATSGTLRAYWSIITTVRLFQLIEQHQLLPWDSTTDTYNQHAIHTMMDNNNPGSSTAKKACEYEIDFNCISARLQ